MTTKSSSMLRRLVPMVGLSMLLVVGTTQSLRADRVDTLVYVMYGYCYGGAIDESTPRCPLGLALIHSDGSGQVPLTDNGEDNQPAWSPDGLRLAFSRAGDVFVMPATGGTPINVTNHPGTNTSPAWSPDGGRIAFASDRDGGSRQLYLMNADGSNVVRLTSGLEYVDHPTWSPDGSRLAFDCGIEPNNQDICAVAADGSALTRLTTDPATDSEPAWSPDGTTIAFATTRYDPTYQRMYGPWGIALMNPDGSDVRPLGVDTAYHPSWSPDGTQIAFYAPDPDTDYGWGPTLRIGVMNVDGTGAILHAEGFNPAWRPPGPNLAPVPLFYATCSAHVCSFDASYSSDLDGSIDAYVWDFGDGTTGSGATVSHTYPTGNPYTATLSVTDDAGATASTSRSVEPNARPTAYGYVTCNGTTCGFDGSPSSDYDGTIVSYGWTFGDGTTGSGKTTSHTYATPGVYIATLTVTDNDGATDTIDRGALASAPPIAAYTVTCSGLACVFDGSSSSDPDGTITSYEWGFGDGTYGYGAIVSHTFPIVGTYQVLLIVRDNLGLWNTKTTNVTVTLPFDAAHVGDIDGTSAKQSSSWTAIATIEIHRNSHAPLAGATVSGSWSTGAPMSCVTDASGRCSAAVSAIPHAKKSVSLFITWVSCPIGYRHDLNHDPDGDSDGTTLHVTRPR